MNQEERRITLIEYLLQEAHQQVTIPKDPEDQWHLLRALLNIRAPQKASSSFYKIEGELLERMTQDKGIVDVNDLPGSYSDPRLSLYQGDITRLKADAIVNAANSQMLGCFAPNHTCIDNCIHTFAGIELREACYDYMSSKPEGYEEPTGQAMITPGYHLPAKYVVHTVGPIVRGRLTKIHKDLLKSCYTSCLETADRYHLESIVFCCISTGVFMFPQDQAAKISIASVQEYLDNHPHTSIKKVIFNVFKDDDAYLYDTLLNKKITVRGH